MCFKWDGFDTSASNYGYGFCKRKQDVASGQNMTILLYKHMREEEIARER